MQYMPLQKQEKNSDSRCNNSDVQPNADMPKYKRHLWHQTHVYTYIHMCMYVCRFIYVELQAHLANFVVCIYT